MEYKNILEVSKDLILRTIGDIQNLQRREIEDYLRTRCINGYPERQREHWKRDYSSLEKFLASVEPNRQRWQQAVGSFEPEANLELEKEPFLEDKQIIAKWISVKFAGNLHCRAVLGLPKESKAKFPLVITQHGISCSPERTFGFADEGTLYHSYAYKLVNNGFAVLAPLNITEATPRARYTRMALLLGKTLAGLEIAKLKRLIDYVTTLPEVDRERISMWGISLGGFYTLHALPLEPRIKVGISTAFFNHRLRKMVIDDPRYSCFLSTEEEHIFIPGWLREFSDSDLVSLICPRPLMIQTGKADGVSWWPFVLEEFENAKGHYKKLNIAERIEMCLHNGGHEIRFKEGLKFLQQWL